MTQERQRLKFKPNIKKRPLEHLKWVLKREGLEKNPVYPSGMEDDCSQHDNPHETVSLDDGVNLKQNEMSDIRTRSVYLSRMEEHLHKRLDDLVHQVSAYRRTQSQLPTNTRAITEAARSSVTKTTQLLNNGNEATSSKDRCSCLLENRAARYSCCMCSKRALPLTKYCSNHILHDTDQLLFGKCNTVMSHSIDSCPTPTLSSTGRPCTLHSLLERFGVTESSDIVEMESSCSESEGDEEDEVETPSLDSAMDSVPSSPRVPKTKIPSPLPENHHPPPPEETELDIDMLPMQPDTILESSLLPDEPDIPLSVRFLEPNTHPANKRIRTKEEEMQARMSPYMKFPGPGGAPPGYFHYPYNYSAPATFLHGYNKEGEPIYGYHDNKQHEYQKYLRQHSASGSDNSRPTTPIMHPEMMAHYYHQQQQQQQRFVHPSMPSPATPSPGPEPKKSSSKKKKQKKKKEEAPMTPTVVTPTKQPEKSVVQEPPQIPPNPYTSQDGGSPNSAASPATMALLKSKLAEPKKDTISPTPEKNDTKPTPVKNSSKKSSTPKNTPPKTPVSHQQEFTAVMMPPPHGAVLNPGMQAGQPNYFQYAQPAMYPGHHQQYYLQMYMQPGVMPGGISGAVSTGVPNVAPTSMAPPGSLQSGVSVSGPVPTVNMPNVAANSGSHHAPASEPEQSTSNNGPVSKDSSGKSGENSTESTAPEVNECHLRNTLTQQRQRQMMIAAQSQGLPPGQFYPQQFQAYYPSFTPPSPASSPKPEKKRKKPAPKEKTDKEAAAVVLPKKKPSLNSPTSKDNQLSSLQSLMSTASSGRLPLDTALPDTEPVKPPNKPRSKKSSTKEDSNHGNEMRPQHNVPQHAALQANYAANYAAYYQGYAPVQGHVVQVVAPMKGYVNGTAPLYFNMNESVEMGHDNKPVVINDAVLARNRPSTVLMKNKGWVEKFIKKPEHGSEKGRSKSKANSSPRRSPQKPQHRNLIFHNTEIGAISDKLAKQQKNAEQRSSHRAMCKTKSTDHAPPQAGPESNYNNAGHPPHSLATGNSNNYHGGKTDKVPPTDKRGGPDSLPLNSQPEGVT